MDLVAVMISLLERCLSIVFAGMSLNHLLTPGTEKNTNSGFVECDHAFKELGLGELGDHNGKPVLIDRLKREIVAVEMLHDVILHRRMGSTDQLVYVFTDL